MNTLSQAINKASVRTKANGLIEARVCYKGVQKSFYGRSTVEWKRKAREYYENNEKKEDTTDITLNEYMEKFLATYKKPQIELSSYSRLISVYEHQIKPKFGKRKLAEITTEDIQKFINDHASGINGEKALAKSGLGRIKDLLNPCFKRAVKDGLILKNPCEDVIIPKESNIKVKTREQFALSEEEIEIFKQAALLKCQKDGLVRHRDAVVLVIMIATGLRIGEALALQWEDVHLDEGYIHIHRTLQTGLIGDEKTRVKDGTKTNAERMLPVNDNIKNYFGMLQEYDRYHGSHSPLVVCTRVSTPQGPANLGRALARLVKRAGLSEDITPHTLRHTFGSALIRKGVGVEVVSRLMGHANIMVTYTKYIHGIEEQKTKAMEMFAII